MTTGADVDCNVGGNGNGNVCVNGSVNVDPLVLDSVVKHDDHVVMVSDGIAQEVNGCFDKVLGEGEADVKSGEEVNDAEMDGTGLNAVGGVVTVDCNGGGNGSDGYAGVFVNGSVEVSVGDAGGVNVDGEVDQFKEKLVENGSAVDSTVDLLVSETNGIVNGPTTVSVVEVKAVEDVVNGSADDAPVVMVTNGIGQGVNGCLDKVSGEGAVDVKSAEEVDDTGLGLTGSTMNAVESSQVTGSELESAVKPSDVTVIQSVAAPDVNVENGSAVDFPVVMVGNGVSQDFNGRLDKVSGEQEVDVKSAEEVVDTGSGLTESTLNTVESVQVTGYELGAAVKVSDVTVIQSVATPDVINGTDESLSAPIAISNADNGVMVNDGLGSVINLTDGIAQDANVHLDKFSGEREADVKSVEVVDDAKANDAASGLTDSTLNTEESSQVTVSELEFAVKPSDVTVTHSLSAPIAISNTDNGVTVNDGPEPVINVIDKAECRVTVDGSVKTSEDLEFQVTADGLDSSGSPIDEWKGQATDHVSGKPYEDMGSQVTADEPKYCGGPIKGQECKVSVDGSDFISSLVDKQECPVSVNESEPSAKHTEKVESNTVVVELDGKSEDHQELVAIPSEVNVEVELNHVCSVIKAENKKAEGTKIGSGIESEENPDSGVVLPEEVDALANGQVEKFDKILEMEETQIYVTEADESSKKPLKVSESSVEMEVNTEEIKEQVKVEDEIQESQRVVIDNVQDELNLEDNTAESANEAEVSSEVETNLETVILENASLQYAVSNYVDKPQEGLQPEASAVETTNTMESSCNSCELLVEKDNVSLSNPDDLTVTEQKVETEYHLGKDNISAEGMNCGTGIENVYVADDDGKESEVKDAEDVPHPVTEIRSPEGMDCGTSVENVVVSDDEEKGSEVNDVHVELVNDIVSENKPAEDMDCETGIKSVDFPDEEKEPEVKDASVGDKPTLSFCDTIVKHGAVIEFGSIGRHETTPSIQSDEIPKSSIEGEVIDVQNEEVEVLEYNFLVKIPRFEDEKLRNQIRRAQELLVEKTGIRDSIRVTVFEKRAMLKAYSDEYDRVKQDELAARRVVRAKRQEIESVQAVINRWKNAMAVEDIDARTFGMEYMIQHETIRLTDEKAFIREIRKLKSLRDQLASSMGTPEDIRHAIDTKDQNEERMKTLRNELGSLKREVSKVEDVLETIAIKYEQTTYEEKHFQRQFRAADVVRQRAYAHLNTLKKLSYDKNKNFRQFKEDLTTAKTFLSKGDKDALHRLCANQVETFMEQWNTNDKFRQEYVSRCIMIASRKQKALDGPPLVHDEVTSVLPTNVNVKVDKIPGSVPGDVKHHMSVVLPVEQGKDVSSIESKNTDNHDTSKSIEKVSDQTNQELKNKCVAKPTNLGSGDMEKEAGLVVLAELAANIPTIEEIELVRKAEELKKEEIAAKLKEQRRLEEKAKSLEALERKKRNAEKAQLRAELRARKEAEQKEKEREKRLRKKEKKTGGGDVCTNGEDGGGSEGSNEATAKEIETVANKKKSQKPPAHFFSKQLKPKPIPPPLINKNKKRWQQLGRLALGVLGVVGVLLLFLLANVGLFSDFKSSRFNVAV